MRERGTAAGVCVVQGAAPRLLHTTIARNSGGSTGDGSGVTVVDDTSNPGTGVDSALFMTDTILVDHTTGITVASGSTADPQRHPVARKRDHRHRRRGQRQPAQRPPRRPGLCRRRVSPGQHLGRHRPGPERRRDDRHRRPDAAPGQQLRRRRRRVRLRGPDRREYHRPDDRHGGRGLCLHRHRRAAERQPAHHVHLGSDACTG